uniref:Uncharacterized protein n=1 Tax=Siphoviridae sp. ctvod4 TaxID=2827595 RepID=A0A8S5LL08_9CAUD|nr:MAG TPA: hypothetical protein [Siphoviridae sp. ctvod4]
MRCNFRSYYIFRFIHSAKVQKRMILTVIIYSHRLLIRC